MRSGRSSGHRAVRNIGHCQVHQQQVTIAVTGDVPLVIDDLLVGVRSHPAAASPVRIPSFSLELGGLLTEFLNGFRKSLSRFGLIRRRRPSIRVYDHRHDHDLEHVCEEIEVVDIYM